MHLGNGAVTPACIALTMPVAAAGLGLAAWALRSRPASAAQLAAAGPLAAAVLAAQMVNFQALPLDLSGHLVGGVLLAWVLGPSLGALSMAAILLLQALLLGDGGLAAYGANVINMALIPAALVELLRRTGFQPVQDGLEARPTTTAFLAASAALGSILLAAAAIVGEVALGRSTAELANLGDFATRMLATHALLGGAEAVLTVTILAALGVLTSPGVLTLDRPRLIALGAAALLLFAATPLASSLPDGYEAAAEASGMTQLLDAAGK